MDSTLARAALPREAHRDQGLERISDRRKRGGP